MGRSEEGKNGKAGELRDSLDRSIEYLRVSVTDRCNLRCRYCMPPEGVPRKSHDDILRYEEIVRAVRAVVPLGLTRVRLTGGEPLVRPGLPDLVRMLGAVEGLRDVALTTNGQLLAQYARPLRDAGLRRINVSLDTLQADRYREITMGGEIGPVFEGLAAARQVGFSPIKINAVVIRGMNDDEAADFARLTLDEPYDVRFIELMPMGEVGLWSPEAVVPEEETRAAVEALGPLERAPTPATSRGGEAWRLPGARGTVAFISPVSQPFCDECNRLRLTADGKLRPCLLSDRSVDLRAVLRAGACDSYIRAAFAEAACAKPDAHRLREGVTCPTRTPMTAIGG
ncbi:MAG: GTP 3',8-cyclase MoaA [Armatimonadetes bacterium]|nr:GTP 3',8-cyclase MoaA [Armatimonadota bacterium]